ncbi:WD40 repeat domain-containing protein [Lusitaniella coriacea]|uniref:WD40 repeat domain-containing protein n=1 Tax=Lusitaniella coriacea TaxID=1983105 RepID=UPI003CFB36F6
MPTFPDCQSKRPTQLNPLNPYHYVLIVYWVFFRPSILHSYLYDASPRLYILRGGRKFWQGFAVKAYRRLYLMFPVALAFLAIALGLLFSTVTAYNLQGHSSGVTAVVATTDGAIAVSAASDRQMKSFVPATDAMLKVWDLERGSERATLKGHRKSVSAVAIAPDGKRAISGSFDETVRVWDLQTGQQLYKLEGHERWISDLAIAPDGITAVSASGDGTLKVWDLQRGTERYTLVGHEGEIHDLAITPDGQQAISASGDGTLKVWDLAQGTELYTLKGHQGGVNAVVITADGEGVISASGDGTLKVWDLAQGTELYTLTGHQDSVDTIALLPGNRLVSGSKDKTLKIWDLAQGQELYTLKGHKGWISSVAVAGERILSASSDNTLKVWDGAQGQELYTLEGHNSWVRAIATLSDETAISVAYDRFPRVWNLATGQPIPLNQVRLQRLGYLFSLFVSGTFSLFLTVVLVALTLTMGLMLFGLYGSIFASLGVSLVFSACYTLAVIAFDRLKAHPSFGAFAEISLLDRSLYIALGICFGLLLNVSLGLANRKALGAIAGIVTTTAIAVFSSIVVAGFLNRPATSIKGSLVGGWRAIESIGIDFNRFVAIGSLRLIFYPFNLIPQRTHLSQWDESVVLPLPGTTRFLLHRLQQSESLGLQIAAEIAANPFQRAAVQRALYTHLHRSPAPLHFLYRLLSAPELESYLLAPIEPKDWKCFLSRRQVLLGELALQPVRCSSETLSAWAESFVGVLTHWARSRRTTPLTQFATFLYAQTFNSTKLTSSSLERLYSACERYPGGVEVRCSWSALKTFLDYQTLSDLGGAVDVLATEEFLGLFSARSNALNPSVIDSLERLGKIAAEVTTPETLTAPNQQLVTFARALNSLERLEVLARQNIRLPEQVLLLRVIEQWRSIIFAALEERSLSPLSGVDLAEATPRG